MSITLLLAAALISAGHSEAPDFRQMHEDGTTALVVDIHAISTDGNGMRNVVVYAARKTPLEAYNRKGAFLYGKFVYSIDCALKRVTTRETVVYSAQFDIIDDVRASGPIWTDASTLPLATYCAKEPDASRDGEKISAGDWQSALRGAQSRLLAKRP
jgi:hypothetical protein